MHMASLSDGFHIVYAVQYNVASSSLSFRLFVCKRDVVRVISVSSHCFFSLILVRINIQSQNWHFSIYNSDFGNFKLSHTICICIWPIELIKPIDKRPYSFLNNIESWDSKYTVWGVGSEKVPWLMYYISSHFAICFSELYKHMLSWL